MVHRELGFDFGRGQIDERRSPLMRGNLTLGTELSSPNPSQPQPQILEAKLFEFLGILGKRRM